MRATEAVRLANVVQRHGNIELLYKVNGHWFDKNGDVVDVNSLCNDDYVPLVPMKTYKVGDVVTFAEALQSGMCFADNILVYKFEDNVFYYWCSAKKRWVECDTNLNRSSLHTYTIVADPSVPQKPTIKDLPTGTIFRATLNRTSYDCVRGFNNNFYLDESYPISCSNPHWTLTHIKNTDGEWEEV